jgi:pyruvate/2-oxoglutarate dehydrogenase complex dihydrolipoamide acyltransferase (E2) component
MPIVYIYAEQNDPGDSELIIHQQLFQNGVRVSIGEVIFVVEGSKSLFDVEAPNSGIISSMVTEGSYVKVGSVIAEIQLENSSLNDS